MICNSNLFIVVVYCLPHRFAGTTAKVIVAQIGIEYPVTFKCLFIVFLFVKSSNSIVEVILWPYVPHFIWQQAENWRLSLTRTRKTIQYALFLINFLHSPPHAFHSQSYKAQQNRTKQNMAKFINGVLSSLLSVLLYINNLH